MLVKEGPVEDPKQPKRLLSVFGKLQGCVVLCCVVYWMSSQLFIRFLYLLLFFSIHPRHHDTPGIQVPAQDVALHEGPAGH